MTSNIETRKDIFTFNSEGGIVLPELVAKSGANTILFVANDGIYINGVKLSSTSSPPVSETTEADYSKTPLPTTIVTNFVSFGRTVITFKGDNFNLLDNTSLQISYLPNISHPFYTIKNIIPIIRGIDGKASQDRGVNIGTSMVFDGDISSFTLTLKFGTSYGNTLDLNGYVIDIDFLIALA